MDKITSTLYNLNRIITEGIQFNIPRYQRLYVWENEQVETLFNDLHTASVAGKEMYYIGGVILVRNRKNLNLFDLVDGQQRFTTLWLLAYELGDLLKDFRRIENELRIRFAIRHNVEAYFKDLSTKKEPEDKIEKEYEDLIRIDLARRRLKEQIKSKLPNAAQKSKFAAYILEQLKLVITIVPQETDLNKLFETLNNRGVQLSQDEILKARILAGLKKKQQGKYASLWNACSDTKNYIERSLSYEVGSAKNVAKCFCRWNYTFDKEEVIELFDKEKTKTKALSLKAILNKKKVENEDENAIFELEYHPETTDDELQGVRSVLTFSQILLHTLRIYRFQYGLEDIRRINEKELLSIFDEYFLPTSSLITDVEKKDFEKKCISFLELLFQVREAFDKYIVKWVELGQNDEELIIKTVYKQNQKKGGRSFYLRREIKESNNGFAQLQRILYHSQQNTTQYWLTPYLNWLLEHPSFNEAYDWLKKLDNILFSTGREDELLTDRTWDCMEFYPDVEIDFNVLLENLGTGFPHYWFYKMDFVLWHERDLLGKKEWKDYKVTAKNSIEHIGPQNPKDLRNKVCNNYLDRMGNLALVTRSINSEYGDKPFGVKKSRFTDKKEKGNYDSLKSDLIYDYPEWNDDNAKEHQAKMIKILKSYFEKTKIED